MASLYLGVNHIELNFKMKLRETTKSMCGLADATVCVYELLAGRLESPEALTGNLQNRTKLILLPHSQI